MALHEIPLERRTLHGHFSPELEPVLAIDSGDTIAFSCFDAGWHVEPGTKFEPRDEELDDGHPLIGPIEIRGARAGQTVRIHETLSLPDGRVIFSSRTKNEPVKFVLGAKQVIPGVEEGVTGMRVGERRKLLVPPSLDGRTFDPKFIPPDAIRHYDIELVEIVK